MRKLKSIEEVGFDLKTERNRLNWSQRFAAKKLGVSYITYQNWEAGLTKYITPRNFENLQSVFSSQSGSL